LGKDYFSFFYLHHVARKPIRPTLQPLGPPTAVYAVQPVLTSNYYVIRLSRYLIQSLCSACMVVVQQQWQH